MSFKKNVYIVNSEEELIFYLLEKPQEVFTLSIKRINQNNLYPFIYGFISVFGPITNFPGQFGNKMELFKIITDTLNAKEYNVYVYSDDYEITQNLIDYLKEYNELLLSNRNYSLSDQEEFNINQAVEEEKINVLFLQNKNIPKSQSPFFILKTIDKNYLTLVSNHKELFFTSFFVSDARRDLKRLEQITFKATRENGYVFIDFFDKDNIFIKSFDYKLQNISSNDFMALDGYKTTIERVNWGKKLEGSNKLLYQTILFYVEEKIKNILIKNKI